MFKYGPNAALHVQSPNFGSDGSKNGLYFFKTNNYIKWDIEAEQLCEGYPKPIKTGWPGLLEMFPDKALSGAIHVPAWNDKIYFFFRGSDMAAVWDAASDHLDPEPVAVADVLPSQLTKDGQFAPVYVDDGEARKVYAMRADEYTRWTIRDGNLPSAEDAGYPRKIGDGWTGGLSLAPTCGVCVNWPRRSPALNNRKIYFFLGDLYTRWDVKSHSQNYRLDIPSGWKGWPQFD